MGSQIDAERWGPAGGRPPAEAFHIERVIDPFSRTEVVGMVRHAGHAFEVALPAMPGRNTDPTRLADRHYQVIAAQYLLALSDGLAAMQPPQQLLHADVLGQLMAPQTKGQVFGWLAIARPAAPAGGDPAASFWLLRCAADGSVADRSLVLLAGRHWKNQALGGDIGLRLALHIDCPAPGAWRARIHGLTLSCLAPAQALARLPTWRPPVAQPGQAQPAPSYQQEIERQVADALGLAPGIRIQAYCPVPGEDDAKDQGDLIVKGLGQLKRHASITGKDSPPLFQFEVQVDASRQVTRVLRFEQHRSCAVARQGYADKQVEPVEQVEMLERDPASCGPVASLRDRRPTRQALALFRDIAWALPRHATSLQSGPSDPRFLVRGLPAGQTATLAADANNVVQVSALDSSELRSDAMGAVHAFLRGFELFDRLDAYGLRAEAYFRHAGLPLVLRPRAAMRGAPGGDAVNAEVRPFWPDLAPLPADQPITAKPAAAKPAVTQPPRLQPQLMVRFAAANASHRVRLPLPVTPEAAAAASAAADPNPPPAGPPRERAQYLGVAADPRWAWHEFGHVLNFAATGELELPFAHGVGDALAAITADPDSSLAQDPHLRFVTYPWVQVAGRRHDRSAGDGYGWCGRRNVLRLSVQAARARHHHGYFEGQLLSSTLFRLYRSLGGDSFGDLHQPLRREAADYCVYLVMRALALLGADSVAPARTPDQLASALIDADLGTGDWQVQAHWPYSEEITRTLRRQGGQVHKVIRWAFEQQGLYATDQPLAMAEGVGRPPAVDVFVADQRGKSDLPGPQPAGDGGYAPVPLSAIDDPASRWLAHPDWLRLEAGQLQVRVANRGSQPASGVVVQCWQRQLAAGAASGPWSALGGPARLAQPLPGAGQRPAFMDIEVPAPAGLPSGRAQELLVNLHSDADPANLPLAQAPPEDTRQLIALVAHDNNLALAHWPVQQVAAA